MNKYVNRNKEMYVLSLVTSWHVYIYTIDIYNVWMIENYILDIPNVINLSNMFYIYADFTHPPEPNNLCRFDWRVAFLVPTELVRT